MSFKLKLKVIKRKLIFKIEKHFVHEGIQNEQNKKKHF